MTRTQKDRENDWAIGRDLERKDVKIDQLRKALVKYGMHESECPLNDAPWKAQKCNCGFDAALNL